MPEIRFAFLNCYNLFPAGTLNRGPRTKPELREKIEHLAATLSALFDGESPDLIGLAEVGAQDLGEQVANLLANNYVPIWSGGPSDRTGLLVLYNIVVLSQTLTPLKKGLVGDTERVRWMAIELQPRPGSRAPFWFVVNHWKSLIGGEEKTQRDRLHSAQEIADFYLTLARPKREAMILIGDFNCEPWDGAFRLRHFAGGRNAPPNRLRGVRERALVLRDRNRNAYFYNPMWRWLGEPDVHEIAIAPTYIAPRLIGTHGGLSTGTGWRMFDQLLVTKPLLTGPLIRLIEGSVVVKLPAKDCTDHCALGGKLSY